MNLLGLLEKHAGRPAPADGLPTRRQMLSVGAVLAAMWRSSPARGGPPPCPGGGTIPWLVNRVTLGITEGELALANSLGYSGYLEYQLDYTAIDDSALDSRLASYTTLTMEPYQIVPPPPAQPLPAGQVVGELVEATILRSALSRRQLYQRMVEFWTDHFNIDINNGLDRYIKTVDDRTVIRPHALGYFRNMLVASAHSPAMLYYLDNIVSVAGNPNENYARELMELHTLGVTGGYTQTDVQELARCLTGWGMFPANAAVPNGLTFRYSNAQHDNGAKTLFAGTPEQLNIAPGGGQSDGDIVLDALARHPSTPAFIARKLCRWLWGENPPQALVDAVALAYDRNNPDITQVGNIREMIRAVFCSAEAATAPPRYKRPYHLFVSALRACNVNITTTSTLRSVHLASAGHQPYAWPPPDGYPDSLEHWVGLILPRWSFGGQLVMTSPPNNIPGLSIDINALLPGANTAAAVMDRIDDLLFGGAMPVNDKNLIQGFLLPDPPTDARKRDALGLAIASPGYQWY
jgi:uncharacterized protein (DUF1800 family)